MATYNFGISRDGSGSEEEQLLSRSSDSSGRPGCVVTLALLVTIAVGIAFKVSHSSALANIDASKTANFYLDGKIAKNINKGTQVQGNLVNSEGGDVIIGNREINNNALFSGRTAAATYIRNSRPIFVGWLSQVDWGGGTERTMYFCRIAASESRVSWSMYSDSGLYRQCEDDVTSLSLSRLEYGTLGNAEPQYCSPGMGGGVAARFYSGSVITAENEALIKENNLSALRVLLTPSFCGWKCTFGAGVRQNRSSLPRNTLWVQGLKPSDLLADADNKTYSSVDCFVTPLCNPPSGSTAVETPCPKLNRPSVHKELPVSIHDNLVNVDPDTGMLGMIVDVSSLVKLQYNIFRIWVQPSDMSSRHKNYGRWLFRSAAMVEGSFQSFDGFCCWRDQPEAFKGSACSCPQPNRGYFTCKDCIHSTSGKTYQRGMHTLSNHKDFCLKLSKQGISDWCYDRVVDFVYPAAPYWTNPWANR